MVKDISASLTCDTVSATRASERVLGVRAMAASVTQFAVDAVGTVNAPRAPTTIPAPNVFNVHLCVVGELLSKPLAHTV